MVLNVHRIHKAYQGRGEGGGGGGKGIRRWVEVKHHVYFGVKERTLDSSGSSAEEILVFASAVGLAHCKVHKNNENNKTFENASAVVRSSLFSPFIPPPPPPNNTHIAIESVPE